MYLGADLRICTIERPCWSLFCGKVKTAMIMSGMVQRMCCVFHIISPVIKQLQTSGRKQWNFDQVAVVLKLIIIAETVK